MAADQIDTADTDDMQLDDYEEPKTRHPLLALQRHKWLLTRPDTLVPPHAKQQHRDCIYDTINQHNMAPYFSYVTKDIPLNQGPKPEWTEVNQKRLTELDSNLSEAKESGGDTEERDALLARANYLAEIGEKDRALQELEATLTKTVGTSSQIDVIMSILRISFAFEDAKLIKKNIARAKDLILKGGDWERKNLLLTYEAVYLISTRQFKAASDKLLESVATFTCYELLEYKEFITYTVISAVISVDRPTLKSKVLNSPEILQSIDEVPHLRQFVTSLYKGQYKLFFEALIGLESIMQLDPYLSQHTNWIIREMRVVVYSQFLVSYRSVTLASMALNFGVTSEFLDRELFRFIAAGRLNAKIDRHAGVVETIQTDTKNRMYTEIISHGDALLNRIQKLTRVFSY